jgi:general secretion pathway protein D
MMRVLPFLVAIALSMAPALSAQEPVKVTPEGVLVDFQDADLRLVITALAEAGDLNVVYSDLPAKRVTLRMQQPVPRENLLALVRSLAQSNGLRFMQEGNFIRLEAGGPIADSLAARRDTTDGASEEVRLFVYRLKHVRAARLGATLQSLFGGRSESNLRPVEEEVPLSEGLRQGPANPLSPDSAPKVAVELGPQRISLPGQLKGEVQIVPDETTNSLLVRAGTSDWQVLRQAVQALDLRPLQVLIEVVIAEVRRTSESELSLSGRVADSKTDPSVRGTLKGNTGGDFLLEALQAGNLDLNLALSAIARRGNVRIVSRPVILAQNNQEARILVGSERPFIQVSRSLPTDAAVRDQVIQYRDVGTKLTITPTINDDGYVNLQVLQEVSTATAETQFGAPVISTREASTHLFVRNGRTAVLGGLIDRQQERSKSGIPLLMEIPVLGSIFGTTRKVNLSSELFLFLTPRIIATDEDSERARQGVEKESAFIKSALPPPPRKAAPTRRQDPKP